MKSVRPTSSGILGKTNFHFTYSGVELNFSLQEHDKNIKL
jgi:hypothetical protein